MDHASASPTVTSPLLPCYQRVNRYNFIPLAVFIAFYCDYVLNSMGVPILPTFLAELNVPKKYIGILFAAKPAIQICVNPLAGPLVDRGGAKRVLLGGLAVLALATAIFGVGLTCNFGAGPTYACLLAARCVQGLSSAFIMCSGMTWIARTHPSHQRGTVMGFVLIGIGAGAASGATVGGLLASLFGTASPFYAVTVLLVADAVLIEMDTRNEVRGDADPQDPEAGAGCGAGLGGPRKEPECQQMCRLLRDTHIFCISVLVFVGNAGMTLLQPTLPVYIHDTLGYGPFGQGLIWGAMTFMYLLCRPLSGFLADLLTKWIVISMGVICLGLGLCLVGSVPVLAVLLVGIALIGSGVAFITTPCMPLLADVVEAQGSQAYGVVYSMADIATSGGMIMGPLMGSLLSGLFSFRLACEFGGLLCLSSLVFSARLCHAPARIIPDLCGCGPPSNK